MSDAAAPKVLLVVPPPPPEEAHQVLSAWSWLLPPRIAPLAVNRFGDWYLMTPDQGVCLLCIWDGTFDPVADSVDEWRAWLATEDGMLGNWVHQVIELYDRGLRLGDGECFAFVPAPQLAGDDPHNLDRVIVSRTTGMTLMMGQLCRQTSG